tara:strand:+ start:474 stop:1505 length:1032 start_codon:yes stop_codon:yes gene_type:complete
MAYSINPKSYFNTKLYTGNESAGHSITGVGFQPDFIWFKNRGTTDSHAVYDAVRGVTKEWNPDTGDGETTQSTGLTSFDSDGFTTGARTLLNSNNQPLVSWHWKMNGAGSSNSDGSITSTVSVNSTAKMSIVRYTGTGASATVGHGLGVKPDYIIVKCMDSGENGMVWSNSMGASQFLRLSTSASLGTDTGVWDNTAPTSTVFYVKDENVTNKSGAVHIAYCFSNVDGFCRAGEYQGNGNTDGSFIYTGFRPSFILTKLANTGSEDWKLHDDRRPGRNETNDFVQPSNNNAELDTSNQLDILSHGFKWRSANTATNSSSNTIIFLAFAREAFVGTNNTPSLAF